MKTIKRTYIVDENNEKIGVQLDIKTFNQIEEILENYALVQLMKTNSEDESFQLSEAKSFYSQLDKKE